MVINQYENVTKPENPSDTTTEDWLKLIKHSEFSSTIEKARNGTIDYDFTKQFKIPCVTYNFLYNGYKKDENISSPTGLLYIDIDDPRFCSECIDKSKIYAMYHSFGGQGWAVLVRVDGLTKSNYKETYLSVVEDIGITDYVDRGARKASQFSILSYDPNIYVNTDPKVYVAGNTEKCTHTPSRINQEKKHIYDHVGTLSESVRFSNLSDFSVDGNYCVNWEGYEYVKCWIPLKKRNCLRNELLLSYCNNLVWLNPHLVEQPQRIIDILSGTNHLAFNNPVDNAQLIRIANSVIKYFKDGTLKPIHVKKKRKIIFNPKANLTVQEKLEIVGALCGERRRLESIEKIRKALSEWDTVKHGKVSIRKLAKNNHISKNTIVKYWKMFENEIKAKK